MEYWQILLQLIPLCAFVYYYFKQKFSYWSSRGVKGPSPVPILGNFYHLIRHGQDKLEKEWRATYGKVYGIYGGTRPILTVADPELIKQVLVKDFPFFVNREVQRFDHDIWSVNIFNAEDEVWRRARAITSPAFTTGKLKGMHALMNQAVDKLGVYFETVIKRDAGVMNAKEVITGFTIDVIASTSFATETNSNGNRSGKNAFLENAVGLLDFNPFRILAFFTLPKKINHLVGADLGFDLKTFQFFVDLSQAIIAQRRAEGPSKVKRTDLVQLMMDAFIYENEAEKPDYDKLTATAGNTDETEESKPQNGAANGKAGYIKRTLSENEIIAQCILFFVAGFETTATTLSNAFYNLAVNPDVQSRLAEELDSALEGLEVDSPEYFDKINNIPYMEATIKETLRMCPPVVRLQRRVGVDGYKLGGITLEKDLTVEIGVYAVHHDPEIYPEPERFYPDRFMPENKKNLIPYTYIPFGDGPRNCLGMRFAYQEVRLCLAKILRQFTFSPSKDTPIPMKYNKLGVLSAKNIPLKVSKRVF